VHSVVALLIVIYEILYVFSFKTVDLTFCGLLKHLSWCWFFLLAFRSFLFCFNTPKSTTDKLQRVLNVATRIVSKMRKFEHSLSQLLHDQLH